MTFFRAKIEKTDLELTAELLAAGKVKPVVDRRYGLADVRGALAYLGDGHARGNVVLIV